MSAEAAHIKKHVKIYILVFVALAFLTIVTVTVSYLELTMAAAIAVALLIAAVKATLVASYFMHLISERNLIYWVLLITVVFFFVLLMIPVLTDQDMSRI